MMETHMLSSVYGEIREVLVVFPGFYTAASEDEYEGITNAFHPRGTVHQFLLSDPNITLSMGRMRAITRGDTPLRSNQIVHRDINKITGNLDLPAMVLRWKDELDKVANHRRLTYHRWAQDPFVTLTSGDAIVLLQSYSSQRLMDFLLPLQLAELTEGAFFLKPTRLCLEGGNMLCNRDCVYIGKDLIVKNQTLLQLDEASVVAQFRKVLGMAEVKVIGAAMESKKWPPDGAKSWQPFFHIDLFLTLGGMREEDGREAVFLGSTQLASDLLQSVPNAAQPLKLPEPMHEIGLALREVGTLFPSAQYSLVELPIYCSNNTCYSWNNCLVEVYDAVRRVYLPSYITVSDDEVLNPVFQVLEPEVERLYVEAGFEVVWIRTGRFFRIIASHGGSLHCVTKVLRRRGGSESSEFRVGR